jgi:hypothetical protein
MVVFCARAAADSYRGTAELLEYSGYIPWPIQKAQPTSLIIGAKHFRMEKYNKIWHSASKDL